MKLYIGNLPLGLDEAEFEQLFSNFSSVTSCKLILNRETNESRGFGFVEFGSKEEAEQAIKEMNKKEVSGKFLVVNEARPQEKKAPGAFKQRRY